MITIPRQGLIVVYAMGTLACAGASAGSEAEPSPAASTEARSDPNLLTKEEMLQEGTGNAYEAVQRLRPRWLSFRGGGRRGGELRVFLDGQDIGDRFFLETIRPDDVIQLEFVGGIDASVRFGAQYGQGVITVATR